MQILKIMIAVFLIFAFLFLPIIADVGIILPTKIKKGYFSLRIYNLPIFSGYVEFIKEGLCLHVSEKKAKIFPYKNLFNIRNTIKPLRDFQIISLKTCIDVSASEDFFLPIYSGYIVLVFSDILARILKERKPYLKYKTDINIIDEDVNIYLSVKIIFNVLLIFLELFRIVLEKIINVFRFQKQ